MQPADSFELWLNDRPRWLQTAAADIIETKRLPDESGINALVTLCFAEATKAGGEFKTVRPGSFARASKRPPVRLEKLENVRGVNAIKTGASLVFGTTSLSVIYGANGSGKSGFSRLLKDVCKSRAKDDIHGNVFVGATIPMGVDVLVSLDGEAKQFAWIPGADTPGPLRDVQVFDSKTALMYITKDNEAAYEPSRMRFVSTLIRISDSVGALLGEKQSKLVSRLPIIPGPFVGLRSTAFLQSLKPTVSIEKVEAACLYTDEMERERLRLEGLFAVTDVNKELSACDRDLRALHQLKTEFSTIAELFSDERISSLLSAREAAQTSRRIAVEAAKKLFSSAPLQGVGDDTWNQMWNAARIYSANNAYPGKTFPVTEDGARCPLCQQTLDEEAQQRLQQFEQFVVSHLEEDARRTERLHDERMAQLLPHPQRSEWETRLRFLQIPDEQIDVLVSSFAARSQQIAVALKLEEIPVFDWTPILSQLAQLIQIKDTGRQALVALSQDGERQAMINQLVDLRAQQWLSQQKLAVLEEVQRLKLHADYASAIKLTTTTTLTRKNGELAVEELEGGYQTRFAAELARLGGGRLSVQPEKQSRGKGKVTFGISLVGAKSGIRVEQVLSEGEMRIVALAAFLADITGMEQSAPFVFDDPISSLDQDFEERVVARLIELAKERQVIVFTHRLSLLALLEEGAKKESSKAELEGRADKPVKMTLTTLRRMGAQTGITAEFSVREA